MYAQGRFCQPAYAGSEYFSAAGNLQNTAELSIRYFILVAFAFYFPIKFLYIYKAA